MTALVSLAVFALGGLIIAVGAANDAEGAGVGPFLLLIGLVGLYASLCLAVGRLVVPRLDNPTFVITEEQYRQFRPDAPR